MLAQRLRRWPRKKPHCADMSHAVYVWSYFIVRWQVDCLYLKMSVPAL